MSQFNKNGLYVVLSALFVQDAADVIVSQIVLSAVFVIGGAMFLWPNKES